MNKKTLIHDITVVILFLIVSSFLTLFEGCSTIDYQKTVTEEKAKDASHWIQERQGFIQNAVAAITQVAVYSSDKDTAERANTLVVIHAIAGNVNALINHEKVDPESIKNALKINEPYFAPIMAAITSLIQAELNNFKENGYGSLSIEILKAVSAGLKDGSTT